MELTIRPKNFKLAGNIESQIRKRIEKLPRYLDNLQSTEVVLSQQPTKLNPQRFQYVAQLTLHTRTDLIRSEVAGAELLSTVDEAMDRISRQIERYKGRHYGNHKGKPGLGKSSADIAAMGPLPETRSVNEMAASAEPAVAVEEGAPTLSADGVEDEEQGGIVRVKRFTIMPMHPEEAIEQMELLGHSFFVFYNALDERVSVVYRRNDGDYGLLEPELA